MEQVPRHAAAPTGRSRLVVEVVSPGKQNQERDWVVKRSQYAACGIPEYWLIAPEAETVAVLRWQEGRYPQVGLAHGADRLPSSELAGLVLRAEQVFR